MTRNRHLEYHLSKQELTPDEVINQLNIRYRVCHVFIPRSNKQGAEDICECRQPKHKHKHRDAPTQEHWSMAYNTREEINTQYHGQLRNGARFVRLALDTPFEKVEKILLEAWKISKPEFIVSIIGGAKYFKLNERLETNFINGIVDIAHRSNTWLLTSGYNIGIVQLVGEAINKVKLAHLKKTTTAIGICKWGSVKDVENVTRPKQEETEQINFDPKNNLNTNQSRKRRLSGEWELEMNHSHYLMLDDGRYRDYDTGNYRTRLAVYMARLLHENDVFIPVVTIIVEGGKNTIKNVCYDLKACIPVVIIGGSGRAADFLVRCLSYTKDLESSIDDQNIVYGIDELALIQNEIDTISSAVTTTQVVQSNVNNNGSNRKNDQIDGSTKMLSKIFQKYLTQLQQDLKNTFSKDGKEDKDANETLSELLYCLQPSVRSDITVFDMNSDDDLSETILRSICRSRQKLSKRKVDEQNITAEINRRKFKQPYDNNLKKDETLTYSQIVKKDQDIERSKLLQLAMNWSCIDTAKEYIFQNSLDNIFDKNKAFETALRKNLPAFVYEFLKLGIDPSEIFFPNDAFSQGKVRYRKFLETLYTIDLVNHPKTHLKYFIEADKTEIEKKINSTKILNIILRTLIGDYMYKLYFDTLQDEEEHRIGWSLITRPKYRIPYDTDEITPLNKLKEEKKIKLKQISQDCIMRDLFLWSILMNYIDMAKVFLSYMKYRICSALIATKILKKYYEVAPYGKLKDGYKESAEYFEQYAIDCLDKCDDYDAPQACEIILQQNELYGYVTCLQVAADAKDKSFIATQCCVQAMDNIWYDKLRPEQNKKRDYLALIAGLVSLGFAAPIVVSYRKTKQEVKKHDESIVRTLRSNGINYCDPYLLEYSQEPVPKPLHSFYLPRLYKFHQSLQMKFCYRVIIYCFLLLLFSYFLLFNFSPPTNQIPSIHWTEILTIILVSCMLIEEIQYFFSQDHLTLLGKATNYFRFFFKWMALVSFLLFYIGLIVRFAYAQSEENFVVARVIMAIDLEIWWLRTLAFIIVIPFLGPHLVAIGKMLQDLLFFICIIAIVMIGYGVASRSMVYYPTVNNFTTETDGPIDASFDGRSVFRQIIYPVYYMMYGEVGNELQNLDSNPNAGWSIATHVLLAIHMIFVNILLVNVLIAMFSKRFEEVYEDTEKIWHSQQYLFTREYYTRSPFFPPISLLCDIYYLSRMFFFYIRHKYFNRTADFKAKVFKIVAKKDSTVREWHEFEDSSTYEYAHAKVKELIATIPKSAHELESHNKGSKEDTVDNDNDANNASSNIKQIENDLITMKTIIEVMKEQLEEKNKNNQ